jgi:hypothetical protein
VKIIQSTCVSAKGFGLSHPMPIELFGPFGAGALCAKNARKVFCKTGSADAALLVYLSVCLGVCEFFARGGMMNIIFCIDLHTLACKYEQACKGWGATICIVHLQDKHCIVHVLDIVASSWI